ncbi:MAG: hypothetical protein FWF57_00625 [Defluviitaleaceae bacterium]|nr:hypothetical protein [Defluviitaleaceae bacterium]
MKKSKKIISGIVVCITLLIPQVAYAQNFSTTWQNHNNNNIRPLHASHQNINNNNFHTNPTDRFMPQNHHFTSGPDYRHVLGQPTFVQGFTRDTSTMNIRRDAQGSNLAPRYGIFSGVVPTNQNNTLVDMHRQNTPLSNPWVNQNTDIIPMFDTTMQGANFTNNPQINNSGFAGQSMGTNGGQMLPSTSILN